MQIQVDDEADDKYIKAEAAEQNSKQLTPKAGAKVGDQAADAEHEMQEYG